METSKSMQISLKKIIFFVVVLFRKSIIFSAGSLKQTPLFMSEMKKTITPSDYLDFLDRIAANKVRIDLKKAAKNQKVEKIKIKLNKKIAQKMPHYFKKDKLVNEIPRDDFIWVMQGIAEDEKI